MTLNKAIQHYQEMAEEQRSNANILKDRMIFNQSIKHNTEAEYYKELMNECIKCGKEYEQLVKWLEELKSYIICGISQCINELKKSMR